jgi:hypothetical protein
MHIDRRAIQRHFVAHEHKIANDNIRSLNRGKPCQRLAIESHCDRFLIADIHHEFLRSVKLM